MVKPCCRTVSKERIILEVAPDTNQGYFKMLKKVFVFISLAVITASSVQAQVTLGVRAGYNHTNMTNKYAGQAPDEADRNQSIPGFQAGLVADFALSSHFGVQPGLIFATQGATVYREEDSREKLVHSLNYLQLPVNLQLKFRIGGAKLLFQAGPYAGYGLFGEVKSYMDDGKRVNPTEWGLEKDFYKITFDGDKEKMQSYAAFDYGVGGGLGLQFGHIQVVAGYNHGLNNITNHENISLKNKSWTATVTYLLGK